MSAGADRETNRSHRILRAVRATTASATVATALSLAAGCGGEGGASAGGIADGSDTGLKGQPSGAPARQPVSAGERVHRELAALRAFERPIALVETAAPLLEAPGGDPIGRMETETEFDSPTVLAVVAHEGPWLEVMTPALPNGATGWIHGRRADLGGTAYSLRVSLSDRELTVRRHGRVVRRVTVAVGAAETPTPIGRFAVTDKLRLTAADSPYGCCALALTGRQPDVPQGWSGGDRLAVHATRESETIGDATSLGCLRAGDADMRWLVDAVPLGTPIEIRS